MTRVLVLSAAASAADPPKGTDPNIGFDYRAFVAEHAKLVAGGKGDKALEHLEAQMPSGGFVPAQKGDMRKRFALIYGGAGKHTGTEVVGYKRLSSRMYRFFAVSHYDKMVILTSYLFIRDAAGTWELHSYTVSDQIDESEKLTPVTPLGPPRD
ncbi:unnamed protein product [Gemmataceae bacterium]|nr:unnamed protein product [Gemmataceae bacterium]VTU00894.1 unnamed protein product [Gemmataceae bacterium]